MGAGGKEEEEGIEGQPLAAQESPSPHRTKTALAATIRGRVGGISLTADVGL